MLGKENLGQFAESRRPALSGLHCCRVAPMGHRAERLAGQDAGFGGSEGADPPKRHAPCRRPAPGAGPVFDDVRFGACRLHADAEADKCIIPNEMVASAGLKAVHEPLCDTTIAHPCLVPRHQGPTKEPRNGKSRRLPETTIFQDAPKNKVFRLPENVRNLKKNETVKLWTKRSVVRVHPAVPNPSVDCVRGGSPASRRARG